MFNKRLNLLATVLLFSGSAIIAQSQSGWRGPDQSGIYKETGLLKPGHPLVLSYYGKTTGIGAGFQA